MWIKFCRVVAILDVITYANFGHDLLWYLVVAEGGGGGSNFAISHMLSSSSLQHSHSNMIIAL